MCNALLAGDETVGVCVHCYSDRGAEPDSERRQKNSNLAAPRLRLRLRRAGGAQVLDWLANEKGSRAAAAHCVQQTHAANAACMEKMGPSKLRVVLEPSRDYSWRLLTVLYCTATTACGWGGMGRARAPLSGDSTRAPRPMPLGAAAACCWPCSCQLDVDSQPQVEGPGAGRCVGRQRRDHKPVYKQQGRRGGWRARRSAGTCADLQADLRALAGGGRAGQSCTLTCSVLSDGDGLHKPVDARAAAIRHGAAYDRGGGRRHARSRAAPGAGAPLLAPADTPPHPGASPHAHAPTPHSRLAGEGPRRKPGFVGADAHRHGGAARQRMEARLEL